MDDADRSLADFKRDNAKMKQTFAEMRMASEGIPALRTD
jgi:hypothetical protein